ncbi:hypothetical protein BDF19DRAFT_414034 [Syncephalis fuscata]|nr:hypothetical protein BDF19DRAFT_414034 [Syncephalis fuscata]
MLSIAGTLALLLCLIVSVFGKATFRVDNQIFQYKTQDLFEIDVVPYTSRGVLIDAVFSKNAACKILPSVLDKAQSALDSVKSDNITGVIIATDAVKALENGCTTIAHTGVAVSKLKQHLNVTSGFLIDTALYIPHTNSSIGFGACSTLKYTTYGFSFYEGASPVNIACYRMIIIRLL